MSDSGSVSNSESESGSFSESNSQSLSTSTSESTSDSQSDSTSTSTSDSISTSASLSGSVSFRHMLAAGCKNLLGGVLLRGIELVELRLEVGGRHGLRDEAVEGTV